MRNSQSPTRRPDAEGVDCQCGPAGASAMRVTADATHPRRDGRRISADLRRTSFTVVNSPMKDASPHLEWSESAEDCKGGVFWPIRRTRCRASCQHARCVRYARFPAATSARYFSELACRFRQCGTSAARAGAAGTASSGPRSGSGDRNGAGAFSCGRSPGVQRLRAFSWHRQYVSLLG